MQKYIITTDSGADLTEEYIAAKKIGIIPMPIIIDGTECPRGTAPKDKEFYDLLKGGAKASTSMINEGDAEELFEGYLKQGLDVLHLSFSSGMSGSCERVIKLAEELNKKYVPNRVIVIDTLSASGGPALMTKMAVLRRERDISIDDNASWLADHALKLRQYFVMDDLAYLVRGGRLSAVSGFFGTILKIKPVLHLTPRGSITPYYKAQGGRMAMTSLTSFVERDINKDDNEFIIISHADCLDKATEVGDKLTASTGIPCEYVYMGPVIGAHTGPNSISVFFFGQPKV